MTTAVKIQITQKTLIALTSLLIGGGGVGFASLRYTGSNLSDLNKRIGALESKVDVLVAAHAPRHSATAATRTIRAVATTQEPPR